MKNLLLTLGHNSSAILIEDGKIQWGFETERMSYKKSDSEFPVLVMDHMNVKPDMAYITHWAPNGMLSSMSNKHYKPAMLDGVKIVTLSPDMSHHDTHYHAALAYAGPKFPTHKAIALVIDGFGTLGEHLSVYDLTTNKLIARYHGYHTSLGLWYQYATAFLGMKMHEDEYKLLGYEVHTTWADREVLQPKIDEHVRVWMQELHTSIYGSKYDPMYDISALANVRDHIFNELTEIAQFMHLQDLKTVQNRAIIAYYVQAVLEGVVMQIIKQFNPNHVLCSGGVFYNVKLNKKILDFVSGQLCVYPLAGDQGNAIGLYAAHNNFTFPDNLYWGKRSLKNVGRVPNMIFTPDEESASYYVDDELHTRGIVNVVRGAMEFGPRALCNTSTLALPTLDNVHDINYSNDRNTVMPMAPVMNYSTYKQKFERTDQVWKSHEHMIVAMEYQEAPQDHELGAAHPYHWPYAHHTGRPQVIHRDDKLMSTILAAHGGMLINTSFNYHGKPIAWGMESIISNHMMQQQRDPSIKTVVITNE